MFQKDGFFSVGRAYIRRRGHEPGDPYELWALGPDGSTTATIIEHCPWCGRKLGDKKEDGE